MFMDPQILAWHFWPLLYPFLAIPPQFPSSAHSSCSLYSSTERLFPLRPSGLYFYLLQSPGLVTVSWWPVSLVWLTRLFLIIVSVMFVCQVCISWFCLLFPPPLVSPFLNWKGLWWNNLSKTDSLTFYLALHWAYEMFLCNWKGNASHWETLHRLARLEFCPQVALHWLFIRQVGDKRISATSGETGTELGSSALCFQHNSFVSVEMKFSCCETPVSHYSSYQVCAAL